MKAFLTIFFATASLLVEIVCSSPPLQLQYPGKDSELEFSQILKNDGTKSRLPPSLIPISYLLDITPILDPDADDFLQAPGIVKIKFRAQQPTNTIVLHIFETKIHAGITVEKADGGRIPVSSSVEDKPEQTLTINLGQTLHVDAIYEVSITFTSRVADDRLDGLYLSQYVDPETGITNYHAATQFQAVGARRAFPCFDEPALRATFGIRLGRKAEGFHTLCNMNLGTTITRTDRPGYVWDVYPPTDVTMPTYLVALVVSNFVSVTAPPELYRKDVKVWGPIPNMASSDADFAAETAAEMLAFFESYFDFEYKMPKMDSVAVPQFAAGAMENWGLNLYRIQYLLMTPGESTVLDNWKIASVLGHELAHQWFGNLVTFRWWNDLWLSEGFANYFQFVAANAVRPEFMPLERTGIDSSLTGLEFDGGEDSVPVRSNDDTVLYIPPSQIIYQKGSSLIRMMQGFLTEATLQNGLQNYLQEKQYGSAIQDELFHFLTEQAQADGTLTEFTVKEIMDTWTTQPGLPLVRVSKVGNTRIFFSQERFKNNPSLSLSSGTWFIPITFTSKTNPDVSAMSLQPKIWLTAEQAITSYDVESIDDWILLNPDAKGHFRVLYDSHFTGLLQTQLLENHALITPLSRAQLIDDYFKSAYGEYIDVQDALELTLYLTAEDSLPVWTSVFNNIKRLQIFLGDDVDIRDEFKIYVLEKLSPALDGIGILPKPLESPVAMLLRTQLVDWACALELPLCLTTADRLFAEWMNSNPNLNPIDVDLQPMFYCAAVFNGGEDYMKFALEMYNTPRISDRHRSVLLNAVACVNSKSLIYTALNMAVSENSDIRLEDATKLMQKVTENNVGRQYAFDFIKTNVDSILKSRVGEDGIGVVIKTLGNYFTTIERRNEIQEYLDSNESKFPIGLIESIKAAIETVESNIKWMKTHRVGLYEFFNGNNLRNRNQSKL